MPVKHRKSLDKCIKRVCGDMRIRLKCHDVIFHFALVQHCATVSRSPNLVRRVAITIDDIITHYLADVNTEFRAVAKNPPGPLTRSECIFCATVHAMLGQIIACLATVSTSARAACTSVREKTVADCVALTG